MGLSGNIGWGNRPIIDNIEFESYLVVKDFSFILKQEKLNQIGLWTDDCK